MNSFHLKYQCQTHKLGLLLALVTLLLKAAGLLLLPLLQWLSSVQGQLKWKFSVHSAQAYQKYVPECSQNVNWYHSHHCAFFHSGSLIPDDHVLSAISLSNHIFFPIVSFFLVSHSHFTHIHCCVWIRHLRWASINVRLAASIPCCYLWVSGSVSLFIPCTFLLGTVMWLRYEMTWTCSVNAIKVNAYMMCAVIWHTYENRLCQ